LGEQLLPLFPRLWVCLRRGWQLFDTDNHVNRHAVDYIFNTEGHLFPVSAFLRQPRRTGDDDDDDVRHLQEHGGSAADDVMQSRWKDATETSSAAEDTGDSEEMRVDLALPRLYNLTANVSLYHLHSTQCLLVVLMKIFIHHH